MKFYASGIDVDAPRLYSVERFRFCVWSDAPPWPNAGAKRWRFTTMSLRVVTSVLAVAWLAASVCPALAADDKGKPSQLATAKSWTAYARTTPDGKVCYALTKPTASDPKSAKRDSVYLLVNDWPKRKVKGEVQIVPGYAYKDDTPVMVSIGKLTVEFFSKNDGASGSAWVKDPEDERRLLDAMRTGSKLTVAGTSKKGLKTKDTYSMAGFGTVLDKIHSTCK